MRWRLWCGWLLCAASPAGHAAGPPRFFFEMARVEAGGSWVGKYEVTQAQYTEVAGENPSAFPDSKKPVDGVSWDDAHDFCVKLTVREHAAGRLAADEVYDLPTDAQWDQFAAGTDPKDAVTSITGARTGPEPIGTRAPNPLGLYDVLGNVWEWCRDWYTNDIRKKDANKDLPYVPTDAEAAATGPEETFKVLRGGAWDTGASDGFTIASRLRYAPSMGNYRTGFRCVVERWSRQSERGLGFQGNPDVRFGNL